MLSDALYFRIYFVTLYEVELYVLSPSSISSEWPLLCSLCRWYVV